MAAITDLGSASSVAAGDYLVVNQSGTDRKATANKFAVVGNTNTFTAAQNFNAIVLFNGAACSTGSGSSSITVGASATTIATFQTSSDVMLAVVWGSDGASPFADLLFVYQYWGHTVIASRTVGSPATRTYTTTGGVLKLAMSAGLWGVRCHVLSNVFTG